ncbi:MAG: alpha-glucosidase, partial [Oscillospiraceae bacterium]|nr:alpha-glucosidase [Oscillospiraceae bacterium]
IFKKVVNRAHELDIRIIMDLVINHTSDEHEWFKKSRDKNSEYRDYYIWRKGKRPGKLPNNWSSFFEKKAWSHDEDSGEYYLHLFHRKQVDLNMDNPKVRDEIKQVMRFWLDLGVDGFREDVITLISKPEGLPDDLIGIGIKGMRLFESGPHIHEYLQEFRKDVLDHYDCFVVGEAPLMTTKKAQAYLKGDHPDLDMMFSFQHMEADCLYTEYIPLPFNLRKLKRAFTRWQKALDWNALYLENHDHPRIISRYGSEKYHDESGKMLAACYLLQKGTPFVYQGQEIGMTNIELPSIEDYKDCAAINRYNIGVKRGFRKRVFNRVRKATRDNSRTPVQWSAEEHAGFSGTDPWFAVNENYRTINVAAEEADPASLLNFYRSLITFRTGSKTVRYGEYEELCPCHPHLYAYRRSYEGENLLILCSFTEKTCRFRLPQELLSGDPELLFSNYPCGDPEDTVVTRPFETRVYRYRTKE